jgi:hypothetical protein
MIIYLNQYRAVPGRLLKNGTYGEHITVRNARPATVYAFSSRAHVESDLELPDDLSATDVDALLNRIYALASQI